MGVTFRCRRVGSYWTRDNRHALFSLVQVMFSPVQIVFSPVQVMFSPVQIVFSPVQVVFALVKEGSSISQLLL